MSFSRERARTAPGVVQNPRHFVIYRRRDGLNVIDILRILHDGRDLQRHIPEEYRRTATSGASAFFPRGHGECPAIRCAPPTAACSLGKSYPPSRLRMSPMPRNATGWSAIKASP